MEPLMTYYSKNTTLDDEEINQGCRIVSKSKCPLIVFFADVDGPFEPSMKHVFFKPNDTPEDIKERMRSSYSIY